MDDAAVHEGNSEPKVELSKRQLKKLKKRQTWVECKDARRKHEREQKKRRKAETKEKGIMPQGPSRKKLKSSTMRKSSCRVRVAVDTAFDHLMSQWDICKVCKQLQRCYSINRRLENPMQFYVTNFSEKTKEKFDQTQGTSLWDVHFNSKGYLEEFDKSEIVYLTSESPNILEDLEESKVYVIGGFVDHNKHKGLCLSLAEERGVNHARLPIGEHIDMKSRKVLTINDVFQILAMKTEGASWKDALLDTIALRKGARAKVEDDEKTDDDDADSTDVREDNGT